MNTMLSDAAEALEGQVKLVWVPPRRTGESDVWLLGMFRSTGQPGGWNEFDRFEVMAPRHETRVDIATAAEQVIARLASMGWQLADGISSLSGHDGGAWLAPAPASLHAQALVDLHERLDIAARHVRSYDARETGTPEADADAYQHLSHATGALERLAAAVDALRADLAHDLVAHQTDNADVLGGLYSDLLGDREYGINPEPRGARS